VTRRHAAKVAMPSGVPVGVTRRAPRRWPTFTSPTVFENRPVPTPTDSTSRTDRPQWTVLAGRELRLRQSHLVRGTASRRRSDRHTARGRTPSACCPASLQLGAEVAQIDRSVVRANVAGVEERPCSGLARSVAVDRLTSPRASTAVMRRRQTQPGTGQASHTQARPRYTEPGRVRPAGSLCTCICVTRGRITL
jgi:hypothetical protein